MASVEENVDGGSGKIGSGRSKMFDRVISLKENTSSVHVFL